jgi:hypothetical protein
VARCWRIGIKELGISQSILGMDAIWMIGGLLDLGNGRRWY